MLPGLIRLQTFCKGKQQIAKVTANREREKLGKCQSIPLQVVQLVLNMYQFCKEFIFKTTTKGLKSGTRPLNVKASTYVIRSPNPLQTNGISIKPYIYNKGGMVHCIY